MGWCRYPHGNSKFRRNICDLLLSRFSLPRPRASLLFPLSSTLTPWPRWWPAAKLYGRKFRMFATCSKTFYKLRMKSYLIRNTAGLSIPDCASMTNLSSSKYGPLCSMSRSASRSTTLRLRNSTWPTCARWRTSDPTSGLWMSALSKFAEPRLPAFVTCSLAYGCQITSVCNV